jgi:hypothetical protein
MPGRAVTSITKVDVRAFEFCAAAVSWAIWRSYTSDLYSRPALPPARICAVTASSASPGW